MERVQTEMWYWRWGQLTRNPYLNNSGAPTGSRDGTAGRANSRGCAHRRGGDHGLFGSSRTRDIVLHLGGSIVNCVSFLYS